MDYQVGQIWNTRCEFAVGDQRFQTEKPRLVVMWDTIADPSGELLCTVLPISIETQYATEYDLLVQGEDSPFSFNFMVEVWNETPAPKQQLRECIGGLSDTVLDHVDKLYGAYVVPDAIPEACHPHIGPSVLSVGDARVQFQEDEMIAIGYLAKAATALLGQHEAQS